MVSRLARSLGLGEGKARKCLQLLIVVGRREKSLAPDARSILSDNGLNNFQTTDAIGNVLKFGVLTGRASETTR